MAKESNIKIPQFVRDNPLAAATISKLNKSSMSGLNGNNIEQLTMKLPEVAMSIKDKIKNNASILELFPDVELGIQIIVSSIVSPNDMINTSSVYTAPNIKLPPDVSASITETIKRHINSNYKLDDTLYELVREAMFEKGGVAYAIIPEASLDDIINPDYNGQISIEAIDSFYKKTNILGNNSSITCSVEELKSSDNIKHMKVEQLSKENIRDYQGKTIEITEESLGVQILDNPSILKVGKDFYSRITKKVANKINGYKTRLSNEDLEESTLEELDDLFKSSDRYQMATLRSVNTYDSASRDSIGMPLTFKLPIESVIPVYSLNDVSKHLGYFLLLDENGLPLDIVNDDGQSPYNNNLIQTSGNVTDNKTTMIERARAALYGITRDDAKIDNIEELYGELVERMIKEKLKNGDYEGVADIKTDTDIYRVMLFRSLRAQQTKLLFLPAELVAYYAFEYRDNGTGKSLLEKNTVLFSIRGILLFATLMASIKNSITTTEVSATLDEQIADPEKIMQTIISEVLKTRENNLPIGVTKIGDLVDWIHKEGIKFKFDHPGLPKIDIETNDSGASKVVPDDTLDQNIRDRQYMSFGLTPEIVQSGYSEGFATTVVAKNLLFSKRMMAKQQQLNEMRTKHIRKLLKADVDLQQKLYTIIDSNMADILKFAKNKKISETEDSITISDVKKSEIAEYIVDAFINELLVELPTPQQTEANNMKVAFEEYKQMLTDYLEETVSSQVLNSDIAGELGNNIDKLKAVLKSVYIRKWFIDNGFMTETTDFYTLREDGKPMFDAFGDFEAYLNTLSDFGLNFLKKNNKQIEKINKKFEKLNANSDTSSSYSSNDDGGGEDQNENNNEYDGGEDNGGDTGNDAGANDTDSNSSDNNGNDNDKEGDDLNDELDKIGNDEEEKDEEKNEEKEEKEN